MNGRRDILPTPKKHCAICGVLFVRRRLASGRLEDRSAFMKRQFCSLSCANSRDKGGTSRTRSHVKARKFLGKSCEVCSSSKNLVVHHCDENWRNNSPDNLQTLCDSCHKSWHIRQRSIGAKPAGRMPVEGFR